ncbi:MAG: hypothetical protein KDI50_12100 [Candidatus Competibacteraceae bacterium]|nr:hypothetical protein [Candidatus Competibacteraceae bacterium]
MEMWKIERFCETATLAELREKEAQLEKMIKSGQLTGTNALSALRVVKEHIALRELFGEN